jgi:hypothetical protein
MKVGKGPNWGYSTKERENFGDRIQSPKRCVLKNKQDGFQIRTRRWMMSKNVIFVLMYHRHKFLDLN